jgi:hypothetical protein
VHAEIDAPDPSKAANAAANAAAAAAAAYPAAAATQKHTQKAGGSAAVAAKPKHVTDYSAFERLAAELSDSGDEKNGEQDGEEEDPWFGAGDPEAMRWHWNEEHGISSTPVADAAAAAADITTPAAAAAAAAARPAAAMPPQPYPPPGRAAAGPHTKYSATSSTAMQPSLMRKQHPINGERCSYVLMSIR